MPTKRQVMDVAESNRLIEQETAKILARSGLLYLSDEMPKSDKTKRIEAHLMPDIIEALKTLAEKQNRSLKNYIETILIQHVKEQKPNTHKK